MVGCPAYTEHGSAFTPVLLGRGQTPGRAVETAAGLRRPVGVPQGVRPGEGPRGVRSQSRGRASDLGGRSAWGRGGEAHGSLDENWREAAGAGRRFVGHGRWPRAHVNLLFTRHTSSLTHKVNEGRTGGFVSVVFLGEESRLRQPIVPRDHGPPLLGTRAGLRKCRRVTTRGTGR